jgi:hypothetical protein
MNFDNHELKAYGKLRPVVTHVVCIIASILLRSRMKA